MRGRHLIGMANHGANMLTDIFCIFGALEQGFMIVSDGSSSKKTISKKKRAPNVCISIWMQTHVNFQ